MGRASPLVDDDRVYTFGAEGMLHCVDVQTGKAIWKINTTADFGVVKNFFGVGSTPVVFQDLLIVQIGGSGADGPTAAGNLEQARPDGTAVVAFDKRTGKLKYKLGDELASYSSPTLANVGGRPWCFVLRAAACWASTRRGGRKIFIFPGGRRSWRASTPATRSLSAIRFSFLKPMGQEVRC